MTEERKEKLKNIRFRVERMKRREHGAAQTDKTLDQLKFELECEKLENEQNKRLICILKNGLIR